VRLAWAFAAVDLLVAGYLLGYARRRQQGPREPIVAVGLVLVLVGVTLGVVTWRAEHGRPVVVEVDYDGTAGTGV
jgi:hypothetical protein